MVLHQRFLLDGPLENLVLAPLKNTGFTLLTFQSLECPDFRSRDPHTNGSDPREFSGPPTNTPSKKSQGSFFLRDALKKPFSLLYEIRNTLCALIRQVGDLLLNWLELSVCRFREMDLKPVLVSFLLSLE